MTIAGSPIAGAPATAAIPKADRVPLPIKFAHGFGAIAYGIKDNGFSTFLLLFYNQVVGLDARLVSSALMLALFIDAFADPVIGHLSDRTYTRFGRRLPWLYLAPIPLGFAWLLMWVPPGFSDAYTFVYLVVVAILVRTLVSCCEVPSVALVPELTRDYDERTGLMRFRFLFAWMGGLAMLFLAYGVFLVPSADYPVGQLNPAGYWAYGVCGAIVIVISVLGSALGQHARVAHWPAIKPEKQSIAHAFGEIRESLSEPAFLTLMGAAVFAYTSQGITFSIANYLYLFVWQFSEGAFKLYPLLLLTSVVGAFFIVAPLHRRFGKKATAVAGSILATICWVSPFALRYIGAWPAIGTDVSTYSLFAFFFCANMLGVTTMISVTSMVADVVEAAEQRTGRRTEGIFFAGGFFMQKCATGLGIFATGMIVSVAGLPAKAKPGQVPIEVLDSLTIYYCVLVITLATIATTILARFPINRADHEERVRALAQTTVVPGE